MHAQQTDGNQGLQTGPAPLNCESQLLVFEVTSSVLEKCHNFSEVSALCCSLAVGAEVATHRFMKS